MIEGDRQLSQPGIQTVLARVWLSWSLAELGELAEARAHAEESVVIAETADHPYSLINAYAGVGLVGLVRGSLEPAREALERGVAVCRAWRGDIALFYPFVTSMLACIYALSGRLPEAVELADLAAEHSTTQSFLAIGGRHWTSETYRIAGRLDDASRLCSSTLAHARRFRQAANEASLLRALANIAADRDPPDVATAETSYRDALARGDELGLRPLVAHCHAGLARLYARTGKRQQAREHLATATTMYREMGMTYWLERAEAE